MAGIGGKGLVLHDAEEPREDERKRENTDSKRIGLGVVGRGGSDGSGGEFSGLGELRFRGRKGGEDDTPSDQDNRCYLR